MKKPRAVVRRTPPSHAVAPFDRTSCSRYGARPVPGRTCPQTVPRAAAASGSGNAAAEGFAAPAAV